LLLIRLKYNYISVNWGFGVEYMFEKGSIIQYFRQKKGLTQEELGHGICSKTHLSKIERGLTEVSDETISLLCARMGFDIDEEIERLNKVQKLIESLQKQLIFQDLEKIEDIILEIEKVDFEFIIPLYTRYNLLKTRYLLLINKFEESKKILFSKFNRIEKIPQPEEDLLNHVLGIYYIQTNELHKSLTYLKNVSLESYYNPEIHYHLAIAYYNIEAYISSYYHCQKAKEFFVQTNNYERVLDTDSIMLMIIEADNQLDFSEIMNRYENLIDIADKLKDNNRKHYLVHNFAFQLYTKGLNKKSSDMYKLAMTLKPDSMHNLISSKFGYMRCQFDGNLMDKQSLLKLILEGKSEAKNAKLKLYEYFFILYEMKLKEDTVLYFNYIENTLLPYLQETSQKYFFNQYVKELKNYYFKTNNEDKILEVIQNYSINLILGEDIK